MTPIAWNLGKASLVLPAQSQDQRLHLPKCGQSMFNSSMLILSPTPAKLTTSRAGWLVSLLRLSMAPLHITFLDRMWYVECQDLPPLHITRTARIDYREAMAAWSWDAVRDHQPRRLPKPYPKVHRLEFYVQPTMIALLLAPPSLLSGRYLGHAMD